METVWRLAFFGQSTPLSSFVGTIVGIVVGHCVREAAKEAGASKLTVDIAGGLASATATAAAGWTVNTLMADFGVGYGATAAQAATTGIIHSSLYNPNSAFGFFAQPTWRAA
uniref:Uncharacterized protein n=1 Tax=Streptomyces sp. NBC_00180 TaxID=2903632 RepID=A0AAU1IE76_9ACTN